ncbi:MAG: carcinine hydrolase/isopenicillin-N N-acyltransferase family protein, partial [Planctomycetota bacterium]
GYTHHWAECADALNEGGLYVAIASLPAPRRAQSPGVQWHVVMEMISERCVTTQEAVQACARVRHLRPMSYLLVDAAGNCAVVEATGAGVAVRWAGEGYVVAANAPQGGELAVTAPAPARRLPQEPAAIEARDNAQAAARSERRLRHAVARLEDALPRISASEVRAMLRDHEAPICTGDHGEPDGAPWATIWSGVCAPGEGRFAIAPGLPCRHEFQAFMLDT